MRCQVGGKGHGLFCTAPLRRGSFVIEYVGEIVNGTECDRRIQEYARSDHFYLMSLRGDDSIDATRKGNLSRFINHACAPNCETQKWEVAGRACVGIFTLHDLPADTEITFDYKYERYGGKKQASGDTRTAGCTRAIGRCGSPRSAEWRSALTHLLIVHVFQRCSFRALMQLSVSGPQLRQVFGRQAEARCARRLSVHQDGRG